MISQLACKATPRVDCVSRLVSTYTTSGPYEKMEYGALACYEYMGRGVYTLHRHANASMEYFVSGVFFNKIDDARQTFQSRSYLVARFIKEIEVRRILGERKIHQI